LKVRAHKRRRFGPRESLEHLFQFRQLKRLLEVAYDARTKDLRELIFA